MKKFTLFVFALLISSSAFAQRYTTPIFSASDVVKSSKLPMG